MRRGTSLLFLACLMGLALPARAQAPLACTPGNVGQRVCQAEGVCECSFFAGGTMFRDPPGYRWDCSLTRGTCLGNEPLPTLSRLTTPGPRLPPPSVVVTRSTTTTTLSNVRTAQADLKRHG